MKWVSEKQQFVELLQASATCFVCTSGGTIPSKKRGSEKTVAITLPSNHFPFFIYLTGVCTPILESFSKYPQLQK